MDRKRVAERIGEWGFSLRDTAAVVKVGAVCPLAGGEVILEHVICDAGMVLALWRLRGEVRFRGVQIRGRRTQGVSADGLRYAWIDQPPAGTPLRLAWGGLSGRVPDIHHTGDLAAVEVDVPGWDGGRSLPRARVAGALIGLQGFDYGGLGGRYTVTVDPAPGEQRILTLFDRDDFWPARDLDHLETVPLVPAELDDVEPDIPLDSSPLTLIMRWYGQVALARGGGGRSWDPRSRHQKIYGVLGPGLRQPPDVMVFEQAWQWTAVPAGSFALHDSLAGGAFTVTVAPDVVVEIRVFTAETRYLPLQRRDGRFLVWAHRVRGPRRPNLMRRRGASWTPVGRHGPDGPGGWQVHEEPLEASSQCVIAWTAISQRVGSLRIPLPRPEGGRCLADVGALARDAAGMAVSGEIVDLLREGTPFGWAAADGAVHLRAHDLLGPLLLTPAATVLGALRGSLYWMWLRQSATAQANDIPHVVLADETITLLRAAAAEARASGAGQISVPHLLTALVAAGAPHVRRWLIQVGLTTERMRALSRDAAHS